MTESLLDIRDLNVTLLGDRGAVKILDQVSLRVGRGEAVGVVGESGSGKSMTALAILRLLSSLAPNGLTGSVKFEDRELLTLDEKSMQALRGNQIGMIFQEPTTSLNPVMRVGAQVAESLRLHRGLDKKAARAEAIALLRRVKIADPEQRVDEYPHQLSGGMRQRVMIASALACKPLLLIADEPTTALDVTIQAQVLALLDELRRELNMALLLISHDFGVIAKMCEFVVVMYAGQVVEAAPVEVLFAAPRHPYTRALLGSMPQLGDGKTTARLREIPGRVPALDRLPVGCRFQDRCSLVIDECKKSAIPLVELGVRHTARCIRTDALTNTAVA